MSIKSRYIDAVVLLTIIMAALLPAAHRASAAGISIDAGLTPAENRWILRSQIRYMERGNYPNEPGRQMQSFMFPVVVAYGVRPNLTVMVRQALRRTEMEMHGRSSTSTGFSDFFLLGKYRLYRVNTPAYTFGLAPTVGLEIPSGEDGFTSDTWDLRFGCFASGRVRSWGLDLNAAYLWNGMAGTDAGTTDPGDEITIEAALAYQMSLASDASLALAPVIESTFLKALSDSRDGQTVDNTGESVLLISPGIKFTWSSFIVEGLVQVPIWQDQEGLQTEREPGFLIGFRLMN